MGEDQFIDLFMLATASETSFSVVPIPARALGSGDDWYLEPIVGEMETLFGDAGESSHRLEVRNGTEKPGVVEWAAERLAPLGYETTQQPDVSGVNFEFTQIRYGSDAASAANDVRELLGTGTLIKDDILENDQIIVIIGLDLADVAAQGATINGM